MSSKQEVKLQTDLEQIISWGFAVLFATVSMIVFFYTNFETKVASDERNAQIEKHLDRIESKLDSVVLKK